MPNSRSASRFSSSAIEADRAHFFYHTFFPQFFGMGLISHPVSNEVRAMATGTALHASLKATLECAKSFGHTDFRPDLASFTVPTLIIHGTADKTVPIEPSACAAAKAIPQAQLVEYDGEPHGLNVTASKQLTKDLLTFVRKGGIATSSRAA